MAELVMPRLSDTMEEGTILRWLVADGAPLRRGQELVEIETDKANMVYESDLEGMLQIVAAEGETMPVGALIARVNASGERDAPAAPTVTPDEAPAISSERSRETAPTADSAQAAPGARRAGGHVKASPLARRLARESRVDLRTLAGTGPGGRIVKADVQAAASAGRAATPAHAAASARAATGGPGAGLAGVATAKGETTEIELSRAQQAIARRMAESKATIPHFALQTEIDMEECVALRAALRGLAPAAAPVSGLDPASPASHVDPAGPTSHVDPAGPFVAGASAAAIPANPPPEATPTYNDMVVKACALALREHPRANSSYRDGRLQLHSRVNVGVAVAVDPRETPAVRAENAAGGMPGRDAPAGKAPAGGALIVPTVFDADLKSLGEIARETRALAARVRDGSITPPELGGGTFTVSNLGMFGVVSFTAIINPPQAAILAVGSLQPRPAVGEDGRIVARRQLSAILACDHRVLYGADAARFLARIRELLEQPASLTL